MRRDTPRRIRLCTDSFAINMEVTLVLLVLLAIVFIAGFSEAIFVVAATTIPYLALDVWVPAYAAMVVYRHPEVLEQ
jgi:hypothetical protein